MNISWLYGDRNTVKNCDGPTDRLVDWTVYKAFWLQLNDETRIILYHFNRTLDYQNEGHTSDITFTLLNAYTPLYQIRLPGVKCFAEYIVLGREYV